MAILLTKDSKVIVQGITGSEATVHTARMLKAGTQIVGGVNARKAGTTVTHEDKGGRLVKLPVFGSVTEAMEKTGADVSIIFVPPKFAKDAIIEAAGQPFTYRSFPDMPHSMHGADPKLYVRTVVDWVETLPGQVSKR